MTCYLEGIIILDKINLKTGHIIITTATITLCSKFKVQVALFIK